jgi:peroxiredoxin
LSLLVILLAACSSAVQAEGDPSGLSTAPEVGALAPEIELQNIKGETVRLSDLRGQVVLVNFWATWCGPCRLEMPDIQESFEQYSPGFTVLAVNNGESSSEVEGFVQELGLTFHVLLDPGLEVPEDYLVRGLPSSYFVDQDGVVRIVHIGVMTEGQLKDYLEEMGLSG